MNIIVDKICDYIREKKVYLVKRKGIFDWYLSGIYDSEEKAIKCIKEIEKIRDKIKEITYGELINIINVRGMKNGYALKAEYLEREKEYYKITVKDRVKIMISGWDKWRSVDNRIIYEYVSEDSYIIESINMNKQLKIDSICI